MMSILGRCTVSKPGLRARAKCGSARLLLSFESLEGRTLLAGVATDLSVGMSVEASTYWDNSYMWANVMEQCWHQWQVGQTTSSGFKYPVSLPAGMAMPAMDSNGYPIGLGGLAAQGYALYTIVFTNGLIQYPVGTYTLTFDGKGTVQIWNGVQPGQTFSQNGGAGSPSNVNIIHNGSGITIAILNSDPNDNVRNIRLVMPGLQQTYQTNPFNPQFLAAIQPFSTLRFDGMMLPDIGSATTSNGQSGVLTWAERTPPTYYTQTSASGVAVEYLVQLCNILHANMWVNMPVNADSEYVTNFAQYVEQNLDPQLKVYVEYGNELWNSVFGYEYNYVQSYANTNSESHAYATADLTAACWNLWSQVFAGQTNRMVRVVATQFANPYILGQELNRLIATSSPSDPNHGFDVVAGAPYFAPTTSSYNARTTVAKIESDMIANLTSGTWQKQLQSFMATVASFEAQLGQPIPVDMYEGGPSITAPAGASWWNAYIALQRDPGMTKVIDTYLNELAEAGVAGIEYNTFASRPDPNGEWGSLEYVGEPSSLTPKYNALVNFTNLGSSGLPGAMTAGTPAQLTITVYDSDGSTVDTGFTGTIRFSSSDTRAPLPGSYTFTTADKGVHTFTVTLKTAGTQSISVTDVSDGLVLVQSGIVVQPAAARLVVISGLPGNVFSGLASSLMVTAYDPYWNVATSYSGTITFTSSDPSAGLPPNYTFTSADAGIHSFSVLLSTLGSQTITATDMTTGTITGSGNTTVAPVVAQWDTTTQGNWIGMYGSQGYDLIGNGVFLPSYAAVTVSGAGLTWTANTTDRRALQQAGGSGRVAAGWYSTTSFTVNVNVTDGQLHYLALYFLDWDSTARSEQVQLTSAATGAVLDTETVSSFHGGVYLDWPISGNMVVTITRLAGANAVLSGLFLDPPAGTLVGKDTTTQGSWIGTYGSQGYDYVGNQSLPSYATVTVNSPALTWTWSAGTPDRRALQQAGSSARVASGWYSTTSFTVNVNLTDGQVHCLALYFLDWDTTVRSEQVELVSAATGAVLDTETVSSFHGGVYLDWRISGNVIVKITRLAGSNAVLSGLFLDPPPATATLVREDTTTEGNWIGTYGSQGYDYVGTKSLASYAAMTVNSPALTFTWAANTTDPRALQQAGSSGRVASAWYSTTGFNVNVNLTDAQLHDVALYFLDWDTTVRSEQVQLVSAATRAVLDTETVSAFHGGVYLDWRISGNVVVKITRLAGANAVLSGIFLDAPT
jgi:hypothetical protein